MMMLNDEATTLLNKRLYPPTRFWRTVLKKRIRIGHHTIGIDIAKEQDYSAVRMGREWKKLHGRKFHLPKAEYD